MARYVLVGPMGKTISIFFLVLLPLLFGIGCSSGEVMIQPHLTGKEKPFMRVKGEACGVLGLLFMETSFIPMALNSRVERAYINALTQAPGAAGLVNIVIEEDWYWIVIGTMRCTSISGEAVR
ncbi:hypothetical protein [Leptospira wolffii]|uniref:Lipoprotein n=3 Tax=Leptospira wolffii TaxID=409998 RepID=A0ABV5BSZ6_9LEPT|nr:hypothetical protein [Leptospira wolffii]